MIKHIVMWRLKDKADAAGIKQQLESMRGKIPGLLALEVGVNFAAGTPAELASAAAPVVRQFMSGAADGPVPFHYPAAPYADDLRLGGQGA